MYLPDLIEHLNENLTGFSEERKDTKQFIAKILYLPRKHYADDCAVAFPVAFIRKLGHSEALFHKVNAKYGFYKTTGSYVVGVQSRKYYPEPIVTELLHGFKAQKKPVRLKEIVERRGASRLIDASYTEGDVLIESGLKINPNPRVNTVEFAKFLEMKNEMPRAWYDQAIRFSALIGCEGYPKDTIPQAYRTIDNGRVVGVGVALQNAPKLLRKALMKGAWDYDFSNCHYTILSQTGNYPSMSAYVNHTKAYRQMLAESLNISVTDAKKCLLAMSYGATKGTSAHYCAIPAIIGAEKSKEFWEHPFVVALHKETMIAGAELLGLPANSDIYTPLANRLQGIENQILGAATKDIVIDVPIYDGFISYLDLNVEDMQNNVYETLGYTVQMTKERV